MDSRGPASTESLCRSSAPDESRRGCLTRACGEEVLVVVGHGEDFVERVLVRLDMNHPAEDDGLEAAIRSATRLSRDDCALQSELLPVRGPQLSLLPHAKVGV